MLCLPQPTEWQRIGDQIDTASILARTNFVKMQLLLTAPGVCPVPRCAADTSGQRGVPRVIGVEVYDMDAHVVLYFAFAQVVQMGAPLAILFEVVSYVLGQKDVSGVPAIHHALR